MSLNFSSSWNKFLNKKISINKKMLFTNFWIPAIALIITILVANAFVPIEKVVNKVWVSSTLPLDDINMIAYIVLVSLIAFIGIYLISLRLFRARDSIRTAIYQKNVTKLLVVASSVISVVSCLIFFILIIVMPITLADLREPLIITQNAGKIISITRPEINTTIYYLMLIPVFIGIIPLVYSTSLALFFEISKRKYNFDYFAK